MKSRLNVKEVSFQSQPPLLDEIDAMFSSPQIESHEIGIVNWPEYPAKPGVRFKIAYSGDEIYLKYFVREPEVLARYTRDEDSKPWTDSCVEFFVIPGDDDIYYNIEMNCIGFGLMNGGPVGQRHRFGEDVTSQIRRRSTLPARAIDPAQTGDFEWSLTMAVPVGLFSLSPVAPLKGRTLPANFYKCGDDLPTCHFLSWSPIDFPKPSFHQPAFFGEIYFE